MYRIVHLTDTHFGRIKADLPERVVTAVRALAPHAVVVTGDITQRARPQEFLAAGAFFAALPRPLLIIPGNHDVPLYNLAARFLFPLRRFNRHLHRLSADAVANESVVLIPVNTTQSFTVDRGRIRESAYRQIEAACVASPRTAMKIVLMHHPVVVPDDVAADMHIEDADETARRMAAAGVDVLLSGHTHRPYFAFVSAQGSQPRSLLSITGGSPTSTRDKGFGNSFYVIDIEGPRLTLGLHRYHPVNNAFVFDEGHAWERQASGWVDWDGL